MRKFIFCTHCTKILYPTQKITPKMDHHFISLYISSNTQIRKARVTPVERDDTPSSYRWVRLVDFRNGEKLGIWVRTKPPQFNSTSRQLNSFSRNRIMRWRANSSLSPMLITIELLRICSESARNSSRKVRSFFTCREGGLARAQDSSNKWILHIKIIILIY